MKEPVLFYEREFYCFSNFLSFAVEWRDKLWMTSEHAYQAAKFDEDNIIEEIRNVRSAHNSKKIARKYSEKIRTDWDNQKLNIMKDIIRAKLSQHSYIEKKLRQTEDREIIEDSHKDSFWGWGADKNGENHLGKIWMKLRDKLPEK